MLLKGGWKGLPSAGGPPLRTSCTHSPPHACHGADLNWRLRQACPAQYHAPTHALRLTNPTQPYTLACSNLHSTPGCPAGRQGRHPVSALSFLPGPRLKECLRGAAMSAGDTCEMARRTDSVGARWFKKKKQSKHKRNLFCCSHPRSGRAWKSSWTTTTSVSKRSAWSREIQPGRCCAPKSTRTRAVNSCAQSSIAFKAPCDQAPGACKCTRTATHQTATQCTWSGNISNTVEPLLPNHVRAWNSSRAAVTSAGETCTWSRKTRCGRCAMAHPRAPGPAVAGLPASVSARSRLSGRSAATAAGLSRQLRPAAALFIASSFPSFYGE